MADRIYDHQALAAQVQRQKKYAWNIDRDLPWQSKIDLNRYLLPLDQEAIAFPGATSEQRLALSQYLGLVINATIAEMEDVIGLMRFEAWTKVLRKYPVNPEMFELGELFFEEEKKHSAAFYRYIDLFCEQKEIERSDLDLILPKVHGSFFLKFTSSNAKKGGHSFWWVVAAVEEVSIYIYREMQKHKNQLDPLYYQIHLKHMEEESRHHNYAFMMIDLINQSEASSKSLWHHKTDLIWGQILSTAWVLAELNKVRDVQKIRDRGNFFAVLDSCLPLLKKIPISELVRRLFLNAPYLSMVLNPNYHQWTMKIADKYSVPSIPIPRPQPFPTI